MRVAIRRQAGSWARAWTARIVLAGTLVSGAAVTAGVTAAQAAPAHPGMLATSTSAVVVQEARRTGFGKILVKPVSGRALYIHPGGPCTGTCLTIWPRLLMPKGTTIPKGAECLGTVKLSDRRLQVTYHKQRLYTFVSDHGHSVTGNGVGGFQVARVTSCT